MPPRARHWVFIRPAIPLVPPFKIKGSLHQMRQQRLHQMRQQHLHNMRQQRPHQMRQQRLHQTRQL